MKRAVASWFGTGLILGRLRGSDTGSGTVGALFALPVAYLAGRGGGWPIQIAFLGVVILLALWSIGSMVSDTRDAGWIVIDEAAGTVLALVGITSVPAALVAFMVFRAADISKKWFPGVSQAERLPGAMGVVADDLVAGIYGLAAGLALQTLI